MDLYGHQIQSVTETCVQRCPKGCRNRHLTPTKEQETVLYTSVDGSNSFQSDEEQGVHSCPFFQVELAI